MAITDTQKVDYLWKKIGYGKAKTDVNSLKNATNEAIPSPLLLRGEEVWAQSSLLPSTIPGSTTSLVEVYPTSAPVECTADGTASSNRTWKTNIIDWIPPEVGDTYLIKVYMHTSGSAGTAASSGTQLFGAGSGNNDEWFFDYKSGTLNFIGSNLPSGISGKSIYISGAVYIGIKGVPVPGAAVSFTDVKATGIATLAQGAEISDVRIGVASSNTIDTLTSDLIISSSTGQTIIDDDLKVTGVSTFVGNVTFEGGTINLGDSNNDNINVTGQFISNLIPNTDDLYDIGITTQRWRNAQFAGIVTANTFDGDLNQLGNTYYVATTGSDSNSGNNINEPFLTVAQALSVATNGDIVNVSAGTFTETCPLVVPRGVTIKGSGLRSTAIKPSSATKQEDIFHLNDVSTVEDITIRDSFYDSSNDTGYAFAYAPGIAITTRSPYIQRVTVLNFGSVRTTEDPYGYDTADSPPTSYVSGRGAKVDGSLVASNSLEAGMLFNEVTFFTPNNKGIVATNGARIEYLNCFNYFASQAVSGVAGTGGIGGNADAKLKFNSPSVTPSVNDIVRLYEGGSIVAIGTITSYDSDYARIDGKGFGTFTSVGVGATQDVRFFNADGTVQTGIASAITLADYKMFGAEMRSIGCAFQYGDQGIVADGVGVELRLFSVNFNHIGSGKDFSNDSTIVIQANEVTELNDGKVSFVSVDQDSNFRVGDSFLINQDTGAVSFAATSYSLDVTGDIDVTDGTNTSNLSPTSLTVGTLRIAADTLLSTSGDININPSGSNETNIDGNLNVSGILTAAVLQVSAVQKGDTSIAIDDTGSDGTIRFNTDGSEALRISSSQFVGIGSETPTKTLDVLGNVDITGETQFIGGVTVSGVSTFTGVVDANGGATIDNVQIGVSDDNEIDTSTGNLTLDSAGGTVVVDDGLTVSGVSTFTGLVDANGGASIDNIQIGVSDDNEIDTSTGNLTLDSAGGTVLVDDGLSVAGVSTFVSLLDANGGASIDNVQIGVSGDNEIDTSSGDLTLDSDGGTVIVDDGLSVVGITTFNALVDANAAAHINDLRLGTSANNEIETSAGNLVLDSASGMVYVDDDLTVAGSLFVQGSTTQVDTNSITVEDRTIELGVVNGAAPASTTTWDLGVLFNYNDGAAKKAAVAWESSVSRFVFGSQVTDGGGTGTSNPQLTYTQYAPVEISALWINDCAGQSQVISCTGTERFLENITIDGGSF